MSYNAITYSKKLREAGVNQILADIQAEELTNIINTDIANKQDILLIKQEINNLEQKMINFKNEVIIKLGGMMVVCVTILGMLLKLKSP